MTGVVRVKELSVIIVSFNGLAETTRPCVESIFENTTGIDYEVIVVDNASEDGTVDYLRQIAVSQPRLRWIANPSNLGFAAANNIGIRAAVGQCFILLNSDTIVTRDSMARLARFVAEHPEAGLVGPVTNSAGNEQMIFTDANTVAGTIAQGLTWAAASQGDRFDTERLGFFCVAMRRDFVDRIGLLDENFGLGFYEDDDYCLRSRTAGLRLVCLEDVFVYHRGSFSFKQQRSAEVKALMKRNRKLLEQKHGRHYRLQRLCQRQLQLVNQYCRVAKAEGTARSRMLFKAANRLAMAKACKPRSALKGLWFHLGYWRLERASARLGLHTRANPSWGPQ